MNFSENLRRLRKAKDIKQEALAEAMNVSRQTVSKWGKRHGNAGF